MIVSAREAWDTSASTATEMKRRIVLNGTSLLDLTVSIMARERLGDWID
jgi:hypothetical protein